MWMKKLKKKVKVGSEHILRYQWLGPSVCNLFRDQANLISIPASYFCLVKRSVGRNHGHIFRHQLRWGFHSAGPYLQWKTSPMFLYQRCKRLVRVRKRWQSPMAERRWRYKQVVWHFIGSLCQTQEVHSDRIFFSLRPVTPEELLLPSPPSLTLLAGPWCPSRSW